MSAPVSGVVLLADSTALPEPRIGDVDALLTAVGHAVDGGVRMVIVRDKHRSMAERRTLVADIRDLLDPVDGTVVIAHDDPDADPLGADGVHLSAPRYERCQGFQTPFVTRGGLVGWSTHDADEIAHAAANGADYVTVSPVYPTASKPGYGPALGPAGLAALVDASPVPVIALGGITTPTHVAACLATGAVGVAVMGAILRSPDPALVAQRLTSKNLTGDVSETDTYSDRFSRGEGGRRV